MSVYFQQLAHKLGTITVKHLIEWSAIAAMNGRLLLNSGLAQRHSAMVSVRMVGPRSVLRLRQTTVTLRSKAFVSIAWEHLGIAACLDLKSYVVRMLLLYHRVEVFRIVDGSRGSAIIDVTFHFTIDCCPLRTS